MGSWVSGKHLIIRVAYPRRMRSTPCPTMVSSSAWSPTTTVGSTSARRPRHADRGTGGSPAGMRGEAGPVAEQRLVGVGQDHPLVVGVVLDLLPERFGLLDPPAHALAARAMQLVQIHRQATLAALHPPDHRLIARLLLEANGYRPGLEHVLQRSKVLGVGGDRQGLSDLLLAVHGGAEGKANRPHPRGGPL